MAEHFVSIDDARKDVLSCATYLAEEIQSNDGRAEAMSAIVPIYLAKGNVDLAAELANTIDDPFIRDKQITLVAEKCADLNDSEYAFQLIDAIEDRGYSAAAAEKLAKIFADNGDFDNAFAAADMIDHPDYAYVEISRAQYQKNDDDGSLTTVESIEYPAARAIAYENLAEIEDDSDTVLEFLTKAEGCVEEIQHDEEKIQTYLAISRKYLAKNQKARAVETAEKARAIAEKVDTPQRDMIFASIALAFFNAGSENLADRALDNCHDKTQTAACLLGFAQTYATRGEKNDAVEALDEAIELLRSQGERETRDTRLKANTIASVAMQFAEFGDIAKADAAAQDIPVDEVKDATYFRLAEIAVRAEDFETVDRFISSAYSPEFKYQLALAAYSASIKAGNTTRGSNYFQEMKSALKDISQISLQAEFSMVCGHIASEHDRSAALELYHHAIVLIVELKDESRRAALLAELGVMLESDGIAVTDIISENLRILTHRANF